MLDPKDETINILYKEIAALQQDVRHANQRNRVTYIIQELPDGAQMVLEITSIHYTPEGIVVRVR